MTATVQQQRRSATVRRHLSSTTATVYMVLAAVIVVSAVLAAVAGRTFFSIGNLTVLLTSTTVLGFVTIGQTLVILVGSLDLSVPFTVSLAGIFAAATMAGQPSGLFAGIALALVCTTVIGILSGVLVGVLKMNGFIATLAVGLIVSGYLFTYYRGSVGQASPEMLAFGSAAVGFVPVAFVALLACFLFVSLVLTKTRTGMHLYAVGGDPQVARLSGVRGAVPIIAAHALSGLFAGVAGLVIISKLGVGSPDVGSQGGYDLLSIAAVVLGGAALAGGRGSLWGSLGGILIFASIDSVMGILELNPYLKEVVRGLIIIAAVAVYARRALPRHIVRFSNAGASK